MNGEWTAAGANGILERAPRSPQEVPDVPPVAMAALAVLLCALLPAAGDARPIDWRPAPVASATPDPAVAPDVLPPPCAP